jgi:hypothetical protein
MAEPTTEEQREFERWNSEISYALKDEKYKKWLDQSEKIVQRYRDQRKQSTTDFGRRKFNILWSNVQTLGPAVYGKAPKPIAERRFLDRDPSARLASMMLERTLAYQLDSGGFDTSTKKAVKDYLLPGAGQVWLRYVPEFASQKIIEQNKAEEEGEDESGESGDDEAEEGTGEPIDQIASELVCFDYVYYQDFLWGPSRCWDEVPWVAKRSYLDKSEAEQAFGKEIADKMTFGDPKNKGNTGEPVQLGKSKKAEVWEIWVKATRCVYFIAPDTPGVVLKEEDSDPLKLEGFWPCPEPLFSTQTNDTLIPVPDYVEYQDQAAELDTLTQRISVVTTAIRANGVYDSSYPALQRLFQEGQDNKLIPVDQWAAFAEKGGMPGALSLVPMDMLVQVLNELYMARDKVKEDIYEITGMSDIIRGVSQPNETATAQKIKSNFATGRLGSRQSAVAKFCADIVKIAAEIVSEVFSPESIAQMSGVDQMNKDAVDKAVKAVKPPPLPEAPEGQPPDPQALQAQQQALQQAQQQAAQAKQQELTQQFQEAIALLRNDKLRGFRVDIETDSTISDDMGQDKEEAAAFVANILQSLESSIPLLSSSPEMAKPIGEMILWALRKFRVGRTLEATFEEAIDQIEDRIEAQKDQPPPPDPEMIKAQAQSQLAQMKGQIEQSKAQSEQQIAQVTAMAEVQRAQADVRVQEVQLQSERQQQALQAQVEQLTLQLDAMKAADKNDTDMKKAKLAFFQATTVAQIQAGVQTDVAQINAQIETILGFAKLGHEIQVQASDHAQQADQQAADHAHQQTMQENAPKPEAASA